MRALGSWGFVIAAVVGAAGAAPARPIDPGPPAGRYVCTIVNYAASGVRAYQYMDTLLVTPPRSYRLVARGAAGTYRYVPATLTVVFTSGTLRPDWEGRYTAPQKAEDVPIIQLRHKARQGRTTAWTCATSRRRPS